MGGRRGRDAASPGASWASEIDRARTSGLRVCEHTRKKARKRELSRDEAVFAARLLQTADIELLPTRSLLETATRIAIELDHPAYDCLDIAVAVENGCQFVTADESLVRKLGQHGLRTLRGRVIKRNGRGMIDDVRMAAGLIWPIRGIGWGTWIRTKINGVRVRCSTVELSPKALGFQPLESA